MESDNLSKKIRGRGFIGILATDVAAIGTASIAPLKINAHPLSAIPFEQRNVETPDQ